MANRVFEYKLQVECEFLPSDLGDIGVTVYMNDEHVDSYGMTLEELIDVAIDNTKEAGASEEKVEELKADLAKSLRRAIKYLED
jgi:hypothetical protein